ncbi:hypothetical protein M0804_009429 [Polistes exclamans]|nr:hypothetical protein M0804_009429 [Polistes exclamans]
MRAEPVSMSQDRPKANGGFDISRLSRLPSQTTPSPAPAAVHQPAMPVQIGGHPGPTVIPLNASWSSSLSRNHRCHEAGVKEMLTSLGLLCLVSLLLALLSLIFLLKISPLTVTPSSLISPEEYTIVYEVTLALCALALSLNLCCLLVCAIQFLFAVKLVKTSYQGHRSQYHQQHQHHHHHHHHRHLSSPMSPPLLLSSTSAPLASTHSLLNVATNRSNVVTPPATPGDRSPPSPTNKFNRSHITREASGSVSPGLPAATLDLSSAATTNSPHELSTLV